MWLDVFSKGIFIGFTASIPLGPVGIMCIQRTLSRRLSSGLFSGLGAAAGDLMFATIAFFGVSLVTGLIEAHQTAVTIVGGIMIAIMGLNILLSDTSFQIRQSRSCMMDLWKDFLTTFGMTWANPTFILVYVGMFATFGFSDEMGNLNGLELLAGVLTGCVLWRFSLSFLVNILRRRFKPVHIMWFNRISGCAIILLGVSAIISELIKFINVNV